MRRASLAGCMFKQIRLNIFSASIKIHSRLFEIPYTPQVAGACARIEASENVLGNALWKDTGQASS